MTVTQLKTRAPIAQTFGGLWICRKATRYSENDRAAMLFFRGKDMDYMWGWVQEVVDPAEIEEGDILTSGMFSDYRATPMTIQKHSVQFDIDFYADVPWRIGDRGSLVLQIDDSQDVYWPSTFDELYRLEFSREYIEDCLEHAKQLQLAYAIEPRIPTFPDS